MEITVENNKERAFRGKEILNKPKCRIEQVDKV